MDAISAIPSPVQEYLEEVHKRFSSMQEGETAAYIPELAKADPGWFGIAIVTVDGHVYQVGDSQQSFTIQSISKPLTYGLALGDHGVEKVMKKVGVEPSGEAFNSINLDPDTGRPFNPMINAGAVATTSLIKGASHKEKFQRILKTYSDYVGHDLSLDELVFRSEKRTGHRNRAIAHLLRNFGILDEDPDEVLDLYFKQCSILLNCRDLAVMASTLANNGVNPITGVPALESPYVKNVLSVMSSCGMYDYAGGWIYDVGMPAKSGVAGGIMAVLPGQLGIGIFSPLLDKKGNSARAIQVCNELSNNFNLHLFHTIRSTITSVIRARYDATRINSKRLRSEEMVKALNKHGHLIDIYEIHGDLMFSTTEIVIRDAIQEAPDTRFIIIDLRRVFSINQAACQLFVSFCSSLLNDGKYVLFTGTKAHYAFVRHMKKYFLNPDKHRDPGPVTEFEELDAALEWSENQLLGELLEKQPSNKALDIADQELCKGLTAGEIEELKGILKLHRYEAGDLIIEKDTSADFLYFLSQGEVSVTLPLANGGDMRITTLSPGMAFGEIAMLDRGDRTANVRAERAVICHGLSMDDLEADTSALRQSLRTKLLANLARSLAQKLRKADKEIEALA